MRYGTFSRRTPVRGFLPYSSEVLARAADELDVLPPPSAIDQMLADYQVMRDQAWPSGRRSQ
jgi:hypothetical protein